MASADMRKELDCSICMSIYSDPVTLACGHNFCWVCINSLLDRQETSGCYSCPECRHEFPGRPAFRKNFTLVKLVEHLREPPVTEVINCTYCIHAPEPAINTCLMCEASLCERHLEVHSKSPEHILCKPTLSFVGVKCPTHGQILVYYCSTDDAFLCASCTISTNHSDHRLELLKDFCHKKKENLMIICKELETERNIILKKIQDIDLPRQTLDNKFSATSKKLSSIFKEIHHQLKNLDKDIQHKLNEQRKQRLHVINEQIEELDKKKEDLTRKMDDIKETCSMTNPIAILRELNKDRGHVSEPKRKDNVDLVTGDGTFSEDLDESYYLMMLQNGFSGILNNIKRKFPIEWPANIMLDVNSAANNVLISDNWKSASWQVNQGRPKLPGRFQYHQVLSTEVFSSGRHYWDVEASDSGNWMVGVAYPSIEREGSQAIIGKNDKSWSLARWNNQYYALHNRKQMTLNIKFACRKFRICLHYEAGKVVFYELHNLTKPVHTFTTAAFTEPLHGAVSVWESASVTILGQE